MCRMRACHRALALAAAWLVLPPVAAQDPVIRVVSPGAELVMAPAAPGLTVEAAVDGGVMVPLETGRLAAPASGSHWLAVRSRDGLGRGSPVRWVRLVVDGDPPELLLAARPEPVAAGGASWIPRGAVVRMTAEDRPAGVEAAGLSAGGREVAAKDGRALLTLEGEGPVTVKVWAVDRVGNRAERSLSLVVDATPPRVRLGLEGDTTGTASGLVAAPTARVRLDARDRGSGVGEVEVRVDGEVVREEALQGPWAPGRHTVEVTARDRVGHARSATLEFRTDVVAPVIHCDAAGSAEAEVRGRRWQRPPLVVTCDAEDEPAGVASLERLEAGRWIPVQGPFRSGAGEVTVRATDRVGNTRGERFRFPVDGDPPSLALRLEDGSEAPAGSPLVLPAGGRVLPVAADQGAGDPYLVYSLGGGRWTAAPERIRFSSPGVFSLRIRACDALDNCTEAEWPVRVERGGAR